MAFDHDELEKRRQQRRERRQREAERKRLLTGLATAAVVLLVCAMAIYALVPRGEDPEQTRSTTAATTLPQTTAGTTAPETTASTTEATTASTTEATTAATTEPTTLPATPPPAESTGEAVSSGETVIRIAAAGDLNVTDKVIAAGGNTYDYTNMFLDVLPVLAQADLTMLNFEGSLCGTPYGGEEVSAPQSMVEALANAGVDVIQTANSCSIRNGVSGLSETVQNIRAAGMDTVGTYTEGDTRRGYIIREIQGIKVAIVAFTKGMDGMALPSGSEGFVNLLYTDYSTTYQKVDKEGIRQVLGQVQAENPDVTIAMLHWGSEFKDKRSDTQDTIRKLMLENGVDAIIGTHPHYVQSIERDEDTGAVIAYSLGDLVSDAERAGTEYSIVLELEITKDNATGATSVTDVSYTPLFTVTENDTVRVVRLEEAIRAYENRSIGSVSAETYDSMVYALSRITDRVQPEESEE